MLVIQYLKDSRHYLISPLADWIWIVSSPLWAALLGYLVFSLDWHRYQLSFQGVVFTTVPILLLNALIHAHLALSFWRTHVNESIHQRFKFRLNLFLFSCLFLSLIRLEFLFLILILATFWDVYHSSLQTFGFGRIYEVKSSGDSRVQRREDFILNLLIYFGPVVSGATMLAHFDSFLDYRGLGQHLLYTVPFLTQEYSQSLFQVWLFTLILFLIFYFSSSYQRFQSSENDFPYNKYLLYLITGIVSIWAWLFHPFGEAFLIMNVFHAIQYFAMIYKSEKNQLAQKLNTSNPVLILSVISLPVLVYGVFIHLGLESSLKDSSILILLAVSNTVAVHHFYADSFIWSVRNPVRDSGV